MKKYIESPSGYHPKWMWIPVLLGAVVYLLSLKHAFVLDDNLVVAQNSHVAEGISGIPTLLTTNYAHGHQGFNDGLYRPLSLVTFAIEQTLFKLNPIASHLIQVLLYGCLLALLGQWLQQMFGKGHRFAFWILLLFALHPIHTEVVANLKSRDEVMALLFFALAAWQFGRWLNGASWKSMLIAVLGFTASVFSKESAVALVAVFPIMYYFQKELNWKGLIQTTIAFSVPTVIFLVIRFVVLENMGTVDSGTTGILQNILTSTDSFSERLATAMTVQGLYIQKMFIPYPLSHDYSYHSIPLVGFDSIGAILSIISVAVLVVYGIKLSLKKHMAGFGILFYFGSLLVVSNLVLLIGALAAERFLFTPSLGWSMAVVVGVGSWKVTKERLAMVLGIYAGIFMLITATRIPAWASNYDLFKADIETINTSARAHYNLGSASNERAKISPSEAAQLRVDAEKHLKQAIEIWPEYMDAYNNLGVVYMDMTRLTDALKVYQLAEKKFPNYSKAKYNLAITHYKLEQFAEAERLFEAYYAINPTRDVLYLIAESEGYQSKFDEAIAHLEILVKNEPNAARGFLKLGMAHGISGNQLLAEENFVRAVQLEPNNADVQFNLGLLYVNTGRPTQAAECFKSALAINPNMQAAKELLSRL